MIRKIQEWSRKVLGNDFGRTRERNVEGSTRIERIRKVTKKDQERTRWNQENIRKNNRGNLGEIRAQIIKKISEKI
jgi:hypothetical protein